MIHYSSSELAEAAVSELNTSLLNGRPIHLRIDREGEIDPDGSSSVYVGNLPWQIMEDELNTAFASFEPYYCRIMKNMSGRSRGFAILKFHSEEISLRAISALHLTDIGGRAIEVTSLKDICIITSYLDNFYPSIYIQVILREESNVISYS